METGNRPRSSTRRILNELFKSRSNPEPDLKFWQIGDSLTHFKGSFNGPPDSPYAGGTYQVDIILPDDYPIMPPTIKFDTKVWHPNISSQTVSRSLSLLIALAPSDLRFQNEKPTILGLSGLRSVSRRPVARRSTLM